MKKLRIGMIGAGNIAKTHLEAYSHVRNAEIVAICDINPDVLKKTAEKFNIAKTYNSVAEMLANEELDAADVCVWNCAHASCSIEALNGGLHVICEKPMATSAKEAEAMIEAANRNNKLLMIGFVMRFDEENLVAKDFADNGYIGDIYYSKAVYLRRHGAPGGWFTDKSRAAGGPVYDLGVHVIDFTRYVMGKPKVHSVYASTSDKLGNRPHLKTGVGYMPDGASDKDLYDVEDFGVALIKYEGNKTTLLETSYSLNGESVGSRAFYGTKGGMETTDGGLKIYTEMNGYLADVTPVTRNLKKATPGGCFAAELAHFVDCALNGTPCIAPAEDGLEVMKILDAIYESARTGHEVVIN